MSFEKASRIKLRYETSKGVLTVEDLWDLPLTSEKSESLDSIAIRLHRELKDTAEESFVNERSGTDELLQLKFDLVKHIIDVRKAEKNAEARARFAKKEMEKLTALLERKQEEKLLGSSEEEILARIAALKEVTA